MTPIIVTGCMRSGTAYTAAAITACGHWCSHERFFREEKTWPLREGIIESSWAAAPHLTRIDAHVIHQVRHPLSVAASLLARRTFAGDGRRSAQWAWKQHPATFRDGDDELKRCLRYWLEWNWLVIDSADGGTLWRLEETSAHRLAGTLTSLGREVSVERAELALQVTPRVNSWTGVTALTWADVPDGKLKKQVQEAADGYGYRQ